MLPRTISAFILVFIICFFLYNPFLWWILTILGLLFVIIGTIETINLARRINIKTFYTTTIFSAVILFIDGSFYHFYNFIPLIILTVLFAFLAQMLVLREQNAIANISTGVLSSIYVSVPLGLFFHILKKIPDPTQSASISLFLLVIVWMTDTGAYLVGSSIGKTKFAPKLSPRKTVEGAIGGFAGAILSAIILYFTLPALKYSFNFGLLEAFFIAIILSFFCQLGDLAESALKRDAGVKDSGKTFTGHGGVLDIIDSLLFCIPVYYLYLRWFYPLYNL